MDDKSVITNSYDSLCFEKINSGTGSCHYCKNFENVTMSSAQYAEIINVDQLKLYTLIWKRTLACQMAEALMDTVAIDLQAGDGVFRANGSTVVFPGFLAVYEENVGIMPI